MCAKLSIDYRAIDSLRPFETNPKQHPAGQIKQLVKSIRSHGFINPIIIDEDSTIVAGHGRYLAAKELGLDTLPCVQLDHLTPEQVRAYRIADNKIAEGSPWDEELLRIELDVLMDLDIDPESFGFSAPELDLVMQPIPSEEDEEPFDEALLEDAEIVSRLGDIYLLGDHRILCGDILSQALVSQFVGDQLADSVFTDPPYNVKVKNIGGLGSVQHAEFAMASGEMSSEEFTEFLRLAMSNMRVVSRDGAVHFICMDWRHLPELGLAAKDVYDKQLNLVVWNKTNGGMGSLYRSQHELIAVYRVGIASHQNNVQLGANGRYRTNVWTYAGQNSFGADRDEDLASHPTVKPIALVADALLDVTSRGDTVLDGFLGSGTTLLAAENTGRRALGIEIEPKYIDVTIRRWEALTGESAIHEATGYTFAEIGELRSAFKSLKEADHVEK
jgi:DNA modification methylase